MARDRVPREIKRRHAIGYVNRHKSIRLDKVVKVLDLTLSFIIVLWRTIEVGREKIKKNYIFNLKLLVFKY